MEKKGFDWVCRHCRNNPTALPPYVEMKPFPVNGLTKKALQVCQDKQAESRVCFLSVHAEAGFEHANAANLE
jgi:hypothetical protein